MQHTRRWLEITMFVFAFAAGSCSPGHGAAVPSPNADLPAGAGHQQLVVAGGCFWCVEGVFEQVEGVHDAVSGYAGGSAEDATYQQVAAGATDHAEVVRITYDPQQVSYGALLQIFFSTHDPTQLNRQGPDRGRQYRSAVFVANDEERAVVEAYIRQLDESGVFDKPLATTVEPLDGFYAAEAYHQDYVQHNPGNPYVRTHALPKIDKVQKLFPERTAGE